MIVRLFEGPPPSTRQEPSKLKSKQATAPAPTNLRRDRLSSAITHWSLSLVSLVITNRSGRSCPSLPFFRLSPFHFRLPHNINYLVTYSLLLPSFLSTILHSPTACFEFPLTHPTHYQAISIARYYASISYLHCQLASALTSHPQPRNSHAPCSYLEPLQPAFAPDGLCTC